MATVSWRPRHVAVFFCLVAVCGLTFAVGANTLAGQDPASQNPPAKPDQPPPAKQDPATAPSSDKEEVAMHDTAPSFKVRVNLVLARVVVRDSQGNIITTLKKEDFLLLDNRKPQMISTFSVDIPSKRVVPVTELGPDAAAGSETDSTAKTRAALPQRFVAMMFDDGHMAIEDTTFVRTAATKFLDSLAASDRVGIYTTSGQVTQEFTDDHELLKKALLKIIPHPVAGGGFHDCPDLSYFRPI